MQSREVQSRDVQSREPQPEVMTTADSPTSQGGWLVSPARLKDADAGFGAWCYCLHLATVFGIALSNALLALSLLAAPWALGSRLRRALLSARGVLLPLGLYAFAFGLSAILSRNVATSLDELGSAIFSLHHSAARADLAPF